MKAYSAGPNATVLQSAHWVPARMRISTLSSFETVLVPGYARNPPLQPAVPVWHRCRPGVMPVWFPWGSTPMGTTPGPLQAATVASPEPALGWRSVTSDEGTRAKPGPAGCSAGWAALDLDLGLLLEVAHLGYAAPAGPLRPQKVRAGLCSKSVL